MNIFLDHMLEIARTYST